jgi:hypothetical protein
MFDESVQGRQIGIGTRHVQGTEMLVSKASPPSLGPSANLGAQA